MSAEPAVSFAPSPETPSQTIPPPHAIPPPSTAIQPPPQTIPFSLPIQSNYPALMSMVEQRASEEPPIYPPSAPPLDDDEGSGVVATKPESVAEEPIAYAPPTAAPPTHQPTPPPAASAPQRPAVTVPRQAVATKKSQTFDATIDDFLNTLPGPAFKTPLPGMRASVLRREELCIGADVECAARPPAPPEILWADGVTMRWLRCMLAVDAVAVVAAAIVGLAVLLRAVTGHPARLLMYEIPSLAGLGAVLAAMGATVCAAFAVIGMMDDVVLRRGSDTVRMLSARIALCVTGSLLGTAVWVSRTEPVLAATFATYVGPILGLTALVEYVSVFRPETREKLRRRRLIPFLPPAIPCGVVAV